MSEPPTPVVRVVTRRGGHGLAAARGFRPGETILVAEGVVRASPSRTTLQIGPAAHLDVPDGAPADAFVWRYLNHACAPNAAFQGTTLVALRRIEVEEELNFDYETTEWELATPFVCACGAVGCEGREIRGFRHLPASARKLRVAQLRADLRRHVADGEDAAGTRSGP